MGIALIRRTSSFIFYCGTKSRSLVAGILLFGLRICLASISRWSHSYYTASRDKEMIGIGLLCLALVVLHAQQETSLVSSISQLWNLQPAFFRGGCTASNSVLTRGEDSD